MLFITVFFVFSQRSSQPEQTKNIIQSLYTQTARWATASLQDNSPLISVLHANYAVGYVQALQQSFSEREIVEATGRDVRELSRKCVEIQRRATIRLSRMCPGLIDRNELSVIAGESI
jgi:hypothetical protein